MCYGKTGYRFLDIFAFIASLPRYFDIIFVIKTVQKLTNFGNYTCVRNIGIIKILLIGDILICIYIYIFTHRIRLLESNNCIIVFIVYFLFRTTLFDIVIYPMEFQRDCVQGSFIKGLYSHKLVEKI